MITVPTPPAATTPLGGFAAGAPGSIRRTRRRRAFTFPGSLEARLTGYSSRSTPVVMQLSGQGRVGRGACQASGRRRRVRSRIGGVGETNAARWRRSEGSDVRMASPRRLAPATTAASTTSLVPARPQSSPAARARDSSSGSVAHVEASRAIRAFRDPRQVCARTTAGMVSWLSFCWRSSMSRQTRRSRRSKAMRAPASRVIPAKTSASPPALLP